MLVYSRKEDAARALISDKQFIENVDYKVLRRNAEQKQKRGGHNRINYRLTVPYLEFFITRKARPVFEVYRQVFHHAINHNCCKSIIFSTHLLRTLLVPASLFSSLYRNEERANLIRI